MLKITKNAFDEPKFSKTEDHQPPLISSSKNGDEEEPNEEPYKNIT